MSKKYIKGKDGKFKGSLADPNEVPQGSGSQTIPPLPNFSAKDRNAKRVLVLEELHKNALLHRAEEQIQTDSAESKPQTVTMSAKNVESQEVEELAVIDSAFTTESRPPQQDCLVRVPLDEVRFMDRDKLTAALGFAVMGQGYNMSKNIVIYRKYAEDSEYAIYRVDIQE
jgi:hypothetical protein